MFSGYREIYKDLRRLVEEYERERREESNEEIVEDDSAVYEEPVAVDHMVMGDFEDERWDLVSIDGGNENNDDNTPLNENADITLKNFISDLMDTKLKSRISDRGHELYLSVIKKALPQPNRLFTTLEGTRNFIKDQKISLSDEAIYHDLKDGKLVIYNAKRRIDEIFNLYKKEIIEYTEEMLSSPQIKDTICGNFYKTISEVEKNIFTIGVQMYFDDANFNRSNRTHQIFPISLRILNLPMSIRNKFQFYIPLAIYYGGKKPPLHLMEGKIKRTFESDNEYSRYVLNIFLQISSVGSLLNTNLTSETIEFIKSVLFKWHDNRTQVISKNHYSKIKSHDMTHLAYVAKYHGPINCFSTFAGKVFLHDLHLLLSSLSMENVLTQITKRLDDKWLIFEKPKFSISDIQESVINVKLPEYVKNNFTNEVRVLKNTIYLSILSKGKIINKMTSNLENDVIDQD